MGINPPRRRPNAELRTREHLTTEEIDRLIEAAKGNRYGHRDATMILVAFRHGLRASELIGLRWDQINFKSSTLRVHRVKSGTSKTHKLTKPEMQALCELQQQSSGSPFVFMSERGTPFATVGFARMLKRAALAAKLEIKVHPQMLRHACGYKLANDGVDILELQVYLGHRNIQSTVRYYSNNNLSPQQRRIRSRAALRALRRTAQQQRRSKERAAIRAMRELGVI